MSVADQPLTTQLARYAATTQYSDLPLPVRREAQRSLFNILGCMLGGARHHGVTTADQALAPLTGRPAATLIGSTVWRPVSTALTTPTNRPSSTPVDPSPPPQWPSPN